MKPISEAVYRQRRDALSIVSLALLRHFENKPAALATNSNVTATVAGVRVRAHVSSIVAGVFDNIEILGPAKKS